MGAARGLLRKEAAKVWKEIPKSTLPMPARFARMSDSEAGQMLAPKKSLGCVRRLLKKGTATDERAHRLADGRMHANDWRRRNGG